MIAPTDYILSHFSGKFSVILKMFSDELDTVKKLYDDGKEYGAPLNKYYPNVAGTILWLEKLRKRIEKPIKNFKTLEDDIVESEEAHHFMEQAEMLFEILNKDKNELFEEWRRNIPDIIRTNMNKNQIKKLTNGCFALNFDDALKAALREVKYMKQMNMDNIPEEALEIFAGEENLIAAMKKLNRIVEWVNYLITNTSMQEYELISEELQEVSHNMEKLTGDQTWYTNGEYKFLGLNVFRF